MTIAQDRLDALQHAAASVDDSLPLEVIAAIRWYMRTHDVNQTELAKRLGVTSGRVSQVLNGGQNLTLRTLESIADALGARFEVSLEPKAERE